MNTIYIVPSSNKKIWDIHPEAGPTPAKNVYIHLFAQKCHEYAKAFYPDSYYILSAKYGFLHPDDIIPENYDVSFKKPQTNPISIQELKIVAAKKGISNPSCIIIVADKDYSDIVHSVFTNRKIEEPFQGFKGSVLMMQMLDIAISSGTKRKSYT
jgi:hypothetical protein